MCSSRWGRGERCRACVATSSMMSRPARRVAADSLRWNPNAAVAVAFVNGVDVDWKVFYAERLVRAYVKPSRRVFLSNPAERPITVKSAASAPAASALLESTLNRELGAEPDELAEYLQRRGSFLAGIARLDMASSTDASGGGWRDESGAASGKRSARS